MASAFNAQSDPVVVFKSFSAFQQSMRGQFTNCWLSTFNTESKNLNESFHLTFSIMNDINLCAALFNRS